MAQQNMEAVQIMVIIIIDFKLLIISLFFAIFQDVARLATQLVTDGLKCAEAYGLGFARLEN